MLASFSISTQLDVGNLGFFVREVVSVDLELILNLREPSIERRTLSISEYRWV